jgi:hypothetical protein
MVTMPEVPKIVPQRLKAGARSEVHPDPDVLAAFLEQALSAPERDGVLAHVASCGDCREIVAMSLPPVESVVEKQTEAEVVASSRPTRRNRRLFTWPNLSWAGLAAGIVFAVAVLSMRNGNLHQTAMELPKPQPPMAAQSAGAPATDKLQVKEEAATKPADSSLSFTAENQVSVPGSAPVQKKLAAADEKSKVEKRDFDLGHLSASQLEKQRADLGSAMMGGTRPNLPPAAMTAGVAGKLPAGTGGGIGEGSSGTPAAQSPASTRETVEVSGSTPLVAENAKDLDGVIARNEPTAPISRAKTASPYANQTSVEQKPLAKEAQGNLVANKKASAMYDLRAQASTTAQWSVVGGALLRSLDAGKTWQTSLRSDSRVTCFAINGAQIWAAGKAGIVYLSQDGGTTWTELHPISGSAALAADVTNIELSGLEVILSAGKETWTSLDTGKTWNRK